MATPIAVFTADNHLRPTTWNKHPDLRDDAYAAWEQIIDYCVLHKLDLIQLGDLFDKKYPPSEAVGVYLEQLDKLEAAGLAFMFIEGNHDLTDVPWASHHRNARHIGGLPHWGIGPIRCYGLDYTPKGELEEQLANIPQGTDVVFTHQSWEDVQPIGHTDGSFSMFPHGVTLLTGDFHVTKQYTGIANDGGTVKAYSPGSTSMQKLNEPPDKYIGVLHDDLSVEWVQLVTRPFCKVELRMEAELITFIQNTEHLDSVFMTNMPQDERIRKPIIQVRFSDSIPEAFDRLTQAFSDRCHLFLEPQRETMIEVVDIDATPEGAFDTLKTAVNELCQADPTLCDALTRLLNSNDPKGELTKLFSEFKHGYSTLYTARVS